MQIMWVVMENESRIINWCNVVGLSGKAPLLKQDNKIELILAMFQVTGDQVLCEYGTWIGVLNASNIANNYCFFTLSGPATSDHEFCFLSFVWRSPKWLRSTSMYCNTHNLSVKSFRVVQGIPKVNIRLLDIWRSHLACLLPVSLISDIRTHLPQLMSFLHTL